MDQALKLREMAFRLREPLDAHVVTAPVRTPRVLAVCSGKGGVGKTNFTINFGLALAARGRRVVVLDADLGCANVNVALGMSVRATLADVVRGERGIGEIVVEGPGGLLVVPGGSGVHELANLSGAGLDRLVGGLGELASMGDVLLIDTAAGISKSVVSFAQAADTVLVVTVPEPPAIADAYGMIKVLLSGQRGADVRLVVNRTLRMFEGRSVHEKLDLVVQRFLGARVKLFGQVPDDEVVPQCVRLQKPFLLQCPDSGGAQAVSRIADDFLAEGAPAKGGVAGFLERLVRWFR